jgi:hypothetical protein
MNGTRTKETTMARTEYSPSESRAGRPFTVTVHERYTEHFWRRIRTRYFWRLADARAYAMAQKDRGLRCRILQDPNDFFQGERP